MRWIRRVFVEFVSAVSVIAIGISVVMALRGGPPGWWAAAVSWAVAIALIASSAVVTPRLNRRHPWAYYALGAGSMFVAAGAGPVAAAVALGGLATMFGYTLWYSRQRVPAGALVVGERLPEFPLRDVEGRDVSSAVLVGDPHVIVFFRGNWCPFCMVQVQQIVDGYRELDRRGVRVALISPQRQGDTEALAARFSVPMRFFSDPDGRAARLLDLTQPGGVPLVFGRGTNGDTVVPTVIITSADGVVVWLDLSDNHRLRPEPSAYLEVIDRERISQARPGAAELDR